MSTSKFEKAWSIINKHVEELNETAYREKLTLHYIQGNNEREEVSCPSISIHS